MNTEKLLARRGEVVGRHTLLESVPGSGYHPSDPPSRELRDQGRLPLSARPVALFHDCTFWVVGTDVKVIVNHLRAWLEADVSTREEQQASAESFGLTPEEPTPRHRQAVAVAKSVCQQFAGVEVMELTSQHFNAILYCLAEQKVDVVSAGVLG